MMLARKYEQLFLESDKKNVALKSTLDKIIEKEEEYKWSCVNWTEDQVQDFLKSLKSKAPNSISRAFTYLKKLVNFICKQEKIEVPEFKLNCNLNELVDYDKLLSTIVSFEELKEILDKLGKNSRIKSILQLAWLTLTNDEIKNLKEEDIEFTVDEFGIETMVLKTSEDRCITTEDQDIIENIKACIGQTKYSIDSKEYVKPIKKDGEVKLVNVFNENNPNNNIIKEMELKNSIYLIKPVLVGKGSKESSEDAQVTNPSLTMQKALQQQKITYPGINVGKLTIEDIKKSKIIYMLHNKDFFNKSEIIDLLGGGNIESHLFWLQKVVAKKYGEE